MSDPASADATDVARRNVPGLESKFAPPATMASQISRAALCESMGRAAGQLVLVRAPAGFGKTTALLQVRAWMERQGVATVWLTLDRADNDTSRFLSGLAVAVSRIGQACGVVPEAGDPVQALTRVEAPYALFLDEFDSIHATAVHDLVREIVQRLPPHAHLLIGTRTLPAIGLSRLRVRGQLLEIDSERLRFNLDETRQFLAHCDGARALGAAQIRRLHDKTEGWVAALWLAALALQRSDAPAAFIERFSGSDRSIADYLAEDVLAQQTPEIRRFLLRTSILRQLDASVCQALNPRMDCAATLEQLDAQHLFLTSVGGAQRAWRYHSLFADFLRAQLVAEFPEDVVRLHLAASAWYESRGRPAPAIDHAIEGGDFPHAVALLEAHAEGFLEQGRMRLLARWMAALPPALIEARTGLTAAALWAMIFTRGPWEASGLIEALRVRGCMNVPLEREVHCMEPLLLAMQDRTDEALAAARLALTGTGGSHFANDTLLNGMAHIVTVTGAASEAHTLLDAARRHHLGTSTFNRMYTESTEGVLDLQHARLRQATARFRLAVDSTHAVTFHHSHGNAWAGVLYAGVVYESNQLEQAGHLLNVYLPLVRDVGLPDHMILSHAMRARMAFVEGDVDAAWMSLTELEDLGGQRRLARVSAAARLERARLLMLQGHAQAARYELDRADVPEVWSREAGLRLLAHDIEYFALARIRWELAFGEPDRVQAVLEQELRRAATDGRQRRLIVLRLLQALLLKRQGRVSAAFEVLGEVLHRTCQEGFMRILLDEGPQLGQLVQTWQTTYEAGSQRDPLMRDYLRRLVGAFDTGQGEMDRASGPAASAADMPYPLEPLTRKEMRVLNLLVEGYSNAAMAEKLYVSDSTVRTHLRNINAKLGAHSRTQAVAIARRLRIIS